MFNIQGLILAGGQSSRMGEDKALLSRDHRDMFAYIDDQLLPLKLRAINISRNTHQVPRLSPYKVIPDEATNIGPLGGIHAAVHNCNADGLLILPIDMPFITTSDLQALLNMGRLQHKPVYYQDCYLPLFLPVNETVKTYLHNVAQGKIKQRSVKAMCKALGAITLQAQFSSHLMNTNTPEQWSMAKQQLEQSLRA